MMRNAGLDPQHAVIIGGSIAGLCAARVLAPYFERVTLYERDELPDHPVDRRAIPQGQHVHLLMARGAQELEALFPGLLDDMLGAGVPTVQNTPASIHFSAAGHVLRTGQPDGDFTAYVPSRAQLEWQLRRRIHAIPSVELVSKGVAQPVFDADLGRVTGVELDDGAVVAADLVVDASGRGSRLPVWLKQWGFTAPAEDFVDVGVSYASHRVRIPAGKMSEKMVVVGATEDRPLGMGMLYHEDGIWTVTTFGVAKNQPAADFAGICELADTLLPPGIAAALRSGRPVGEMKFHRYPTSKWRRYDRIALPMGIVPFGDAVVSLNPTFGQGVTMSAIQARNLQAVLAKGTTDLGFRLTRATARTTWPIWQMNAAADHSEHHAGGRRPFWYKPVYGAFKQFVSAAVTDPVLAEWFLRRTNLLDSLYLVPSPRMVGRAIRNNARLWLAERKSHQRTDAPVHH